jgi:hypothetical protein
MAKVKATDAALRKSRKAKSAATPAALPPTPAVPALPPHPQIENLYVERVYSFDGFMEFIKRRFPADQFRLAIYPSYLHAGWRVLSGSLFVSSEDNPNYKVLNELVHNAQGAYVITKENWPLLREMMRYNGDGIYMTPTATTKLQDEGKWTMTDLHTGGTHIAGRRIALMYANQLWSKFKIPPNPYHSLHLSPNDPALIRYYDEKTLDRDLPIETTITKYLKRFHPHLTDADLKEISALHKLTYVDDGLEFFDKAEDFVRVYQNGPTSCMAKSNEVYGSHVNPLLPYEMPGIRLVAMRERVVDGITKYSSRCFLFEPNEDDKRYIRIYGNTELMRARLEKRGYKLGTWEGAHLKKIPALMKDGTPLPNTWVFPYIDDFPSRVTCSTDVVTQTAVTRPGWDHWLITTNKNLESFSRMYRDLLAYDAVSATGLMGVWHGYTPKQHRMWHAKINGLPYEKPNAERPNQYGEVLCTDCGAITEAPSYLPVFLPAYNVHRYSCTSCNEVHLRASRYFRSDRQYNGMPALFRVDGAFAIPKADSRARKVYYGHDSIAAVAAGTHFPCLRDELEQHGLIILDDALYSFPTVVKSAQAIQIKGQWVHKEDIVEDVFGDTDAKQRMHFLGQNIEGERIQFFPDNYEKITKALKLGRFFIRGNKIEYDASGTFRPEHRNAHFQTVGEFDEDAADLSNTQRVPLVEVLNLLMPIYGEHDVVACLQRILPNVSYGFLLNCVTTYSSMTTNQFASIVGITNLTPQYQYLYQQMHREPEHAFLANKERDLRAKATATAPTIEIRPTTF